MEVPQCDPGGKSSQKLFSGNYVAMMYSERKQTANCQLHILDSSFIW